MLKTTQLPTTSLDRNVLRTSAKLFHVAFLVLSSHCFNGCSASGRFSQKSLSIFLLSIFTGTRRFDVSKFAHMYQVRADGPRKLLK
jgi:hypothetical protein